MAKEWAAGFYHSATWKKQRKYILKRDNYICTEPSCNRVATEVHHIIELNENNINDINISLNENNLRSLCHDCHTRITSQMKWEQEHGSENVLEEITFDADGYPVVLNCTVPPTKN